MSIFRDNPVSWTLDIPLYQQLYTHLRAAILSGELKHGLKLPATRALADELNLSRNTVLNAYRQLIAEGYLVSSVGNGTFVAQVLPDHLLTPSEQRDTADVKPIGAQPPRYSDHARLQLATPKMSDMTPSPAGVSPRPFRFGIPDLQAFPYKLWSRLTVRRARNMPADAFTYQDLAGSLPLREAIAAHVAISRRVH
jgi:GntR family transcriptional regulator/MocR family aminotransferase